jgi:type II secretory pathway component PulC
VAEKKSERVKIYLIIALSIVLIVVVYFRFFHKKKTHAAVPVRYRATIAQLAVPEVNLPLSHKDGAPNKEGPAQASALPRDIFQPAKALPPKKEPQPHAEKPTRPTMSLTLKGTITGGENPIAVINDQFVYAGDRIGDYEVTTVANDEVVLTSDTHSMVLKVLKIAEK